MKALTGASMEYIVCPKLDAIENFRFLKDHRRKRGGERRKGNILQKSVTSLIVIIMLYHMG